jgi:6-phosphogluconate dehydrogenase
MPLGQENKNRETKYKRGIYKRNHKIGQFLVPIEIGLVQLVWRAGCIIPNELSGKVEILVEERSSVLLCYFLLHMSRESKPVRYEKTSMTLI